jgi:uncharacterized protein (DUF924 family)
VSVPRHAAILGFWFGEECGAERGRRRRTWFTKNPVFDAEVRRRFFDDYRMARSGAFDEWRERAEGCLALILLLDQFPRNMFRGTPEAFGGDAQALTAARHAVECRFDRTLPPRQRMFVYLPFEHSESLVDQRRSVELFADLRGVAGFEDVLDYAERHLRIIERFHRFPHRNAILGRQSTPAEAEFLRRPGSAF